MTSSGTGRGAAPTFVVYVMLALTWGSSFLLMKVALKGFAPGQIALGRILVGAATLAGIMLVTRRSWPRERPLWWHMAIVAFFLCVAPFLLFAWAGQFLPSGLSAVLNSTTPIWTAIVMAAAIRGTRLARGQVFGIVLGFVGVMLVMGVWQVITDPGFLGSLPAQGACLAATASYGIAFTWMQRFVTGKHDHDAAPITPEPAPVFCLLTLGVLGTGLAYVWNTRILPYGARSQPPP